MSKCMLDQMLSPFWIYFYYSQCVRLSSVFWPRIDGIGIGGIYVFKIMIDNEYD